MCRALKVMRSGFYAWLKRKPSAGQIRQQKLLVKIQQVYQEHDGRYGSPRVHRRALLMDGEHVSRNTVAKLMRRAKIRAKTRRRFVPRTTDSAHDKPVAQNLLDRDFTASAPNQKWVADITYVDTAEGWLFCAAVLDCYSRKVVGWAMSDAMPTDLVADALKMALLHRQPSGDLLHHSDRGSQYASDASPERTTSSVARYGISVSMMLHRGNCYDNAMMESFWATLKTELIHQHRYCTRAQARQSIFDYIEVYYNRKRLHSSLGLCQPRTFEVASKTSSSNASRNVGRAPPPTSPLPQTLHTSPPSPPPTPLRPESPADIETSSTLSAEAQNPASPSRRSARPRQADSRRTGHTLARANTWGSRHSADDRASAP